MSKPSFRSVLLALRFHRSPPAEKTFHRWILSCDARRNLTGRRFERLRPLTKDCSTKAVLGAEFPSPSPDSPKISF